MQDDMTTSSQYIARMVPTIQESEEKIKGEAPRAVKALKKLGALDVADALGLTPYLEGAN